MPLLLEFVWILRSNNALASQVVTLWYRAPEIPPWWDPLLDPCGHVGQSAASLQSFGMGERSFLETL